MTPDFRRAVFKWKYDKEKDGEESFCIPLQLQRLFGYLQLSKSKAVDTVDLTRSVVSLINWSHWTIMKSFLLDTCSQIFLHRSEQIISFSIDDLILIHIIEQKIINANSDNNNS
jgi:hypothetical protein